MLSTPVKAIALVLFIAAIAGASYGVNQVLGDTIEAQIFSVSSPRALLNATGGHTVTYLMNITNRDAAARDVVIAIDGIAEGQSAVTTVRGGSNAAVYVSVDVPADVSPGTYPLDVSVIQDGRTLREREGALDLVILPDAPGFEDGDLAEAVYTGHLTATGRVFSSNDAAIIGMPVLKTDNYRFQQSLLRVVTAPRATVVEGLAEGVIGMQAGESRTVSFPPEKGYGPATEDQRLPRDDVLRREISLLNEPHRVPFSAFEQHINASLQGDARSYETGDVFFLEQNENQWPYLITNLTDQFVEYKLAANVGDAFTIYPFWANASVVTAMNDTHVTFRTTPNKAPGEKITVKEYWPLMSELLSYNETQIVLRNSPPVGYTYTMLTQAGQPREATVVEVTDEYVRTALPSQNPLAGKDLTFDVLLVAVEKA